MGYFKASYRGTEKGVYGSNGQIYLLITRKLFGGYNVTPCHGYELKPMIGMTVHYDSLGELIEEWELIGTVEAHSLIG